jgi:peptide/nickel transport system substrate-binding protein
VNVNRSASDEISIRKRLSRRQALRIGLSLAALPLAVACGNTAAPAPTTAPAKPTEASKPAGAAPASGGSPAAAASPAAAGSPAAAQAAPAAAAGTNKPGGTGTLKLLFWQAVTILNPHLSQGTKDYMAARCCTEPLITVDNDGKVSPVLAAEVPSTQNGGLSADGKSVTYKLKQGVMWADGQPFSADDVAFTFQFITNKESSAVTAGTYSNIDKVEAVDPNTVKITFKDPTGGWMVPFSGSNGQVLPAHLMKDYIGAKSREAPINTKLVGTGPWMVDDFKPGDLVVYKPNPYYREQGKPFFERLEIKGGGDAVSAGRSVFQTGEYDYAWNLQVEAPVLQDMMNGGKGDLVTSPGGGVEQLYFNFADNTKETNGEHGAPGTQHPFLKDMKVRQAMSMAIDRETLVKQLYGPTGTPTINVLTTPVSLNSPNTKMVFDIDGANKLLDEAGYKKGGDGIRMTPDGIRMKVVYQTSINSLRQKEQAIVKDGWTKIGIDCELKSVDAGVFFSSDPGNPHIFARFSTDVQMFTSTFDSPFPVAYMNRFYTGADPSRTWGQKSNNWSGRNFMKWKNDQFDKLFDQVLTELNQEKATQMWQQLNDLVVDDYADVGIVDRKSASGKAKNLTGPDLRAFDNETWNIADWKKA